MEWDFCILINFFESISHVLRCDGILFNYESESHVSNILWYSVLSGLYLLTTHS